MEKFTDRLEIIVFADLNEKHKPVLAREREARLIFESCGMVLCPVPNSFLPQVCEDM